MKNCWYLTSIPFQRRKARKVGDFLRFLRNNIRLLSKIILIFRGDFNPTSRRRKLKFHSIDYRSNDYLAINRCCPNLIERREKKFSFYTQYSMRCDSERVSITSLLGIYIHSRNGMNNKKKGGGRGKKRYTTIDDTTHDENKQSMINCCLVEFIGNVETVIKSMFAHFEASHQYQYAQNGVRKMFHSCLFIPRNICVIRV